MTRPTLIATAATLALLLPAAPATAVRPVDLLDVTLHAEGGVRDLDVVLFDHVLVPGDSGTRTLRVHNAGPTDALVTAAVADTALVAATPGSGVHDHLLINGVALSTLAEGEHVLHRRTVPQGSTVDLPFRFELPLADVGNTALVGEHAATFTVHLHAEGALPPVEGPGGDGPGDHGPGGDGPAVDGPGGAAQDAGTGAAAGTTGTAGTTVGYRAETGGVAAAARTLWPFALAGALVAGLLARRGREGGHRAPAG